MGVGGPLPPGQSPAFGSRGLSASVFSTLKVPLFESCSFSGPSCCLNPSMSIYVTSPSRSYRKLSGLALRLCHPLGVRGSGERADTDDEGMEALFMKTMVGNCWATLL